jgi:hypothetical protein
VWLKKAIREELLITFFSFLDLAQGDATNALLGEFKQSRPLPADRDASSPSSYNAKSVGDKSQNETARKFLGIIEYDMKLIRRDIDTCLGIASKLDEKGQARAAVVIRNSFFREFMTGNPSSSSLLVNGRADLNSANGPSPLSLVAGKLSQVFLDISEGQNASFLIEYFC